MDFKLRTDAKTWFNDLLRSEGLLDFDIYYFCLMAGILDGRLEPTDKHKHVAFLDYYPGSYRHRGRILVGVLLREELRRLRIRLDDQLTVRNIIKRLIKADSPSFLTDEGVELMNAYASGGFEVLLEYYTDRPRTMETFIRNYHKCLKEIEIKRQEEKSV